MFLDDVDQRTIVALGLRLVATERVPLDDDAFDRFCRDLAARAATALQAQGVRAVPPFPGVALPQPSAASGERRAVFAAALWRENAQVGTAITALIRGRVPNISVAPRYDSPTGPRSDPQSPERIE